MNNNYEKQMFDEAATDDYLKRVVALCGTDNWDTSPGFTKKQSKDFYLGMIASERVIVSFMNKWSGEDLMLAITKLGMYAAIIANEKTKELELR
jgi:hypothetical protein